MSSASNEVSSPDGFPPAFATSVDESELTRDGFCMIRGFADEREIWSLREVLTTEFGEMAKGSGNRRGLLDRCSEIASLASGERVQYFLNGFALGEWQAVRGILFDKTDTANWHVRWHQDQTIAIKKRFEIDGFSGWSEKEGICHVQAPAEVLRKMVSVRIHLDDAGCDNGALRVVPGTHLHGKLVAADRSRLRDETREVMCNARAGDVLIMRPLLLHASAIAENPRHRRVIHLDYTCGKLPGELDWFWQL